MPDDAECRMPNIMPTHVHLDTSHTWDFRSRKAWLDKAGRGVNNDAIGCNNVECWKTAQVSKSWCSLGDNTVTSLGSAVQSRCNLSDFGQEGSSTKTSCLV